MTWTCSGIARQVVVLSPNVGWLRSSSKWCCGWFDAAGVGSISSQAGWGSTAGLSRFHGVRRSSVETWNFNPSPKAQFCINCFKFGVRDYVTEVTNPDKVGSGQMKDRDAKWHFVMASRRPIYTFQLTGYATESNEQNIVAVLSEWLTPLTTFINW